MPWRLIREARLCAAVSCAELLLGPSAARGCMKVAMLAAIAAAAVAVLYARCEVCFGVQFTVAAAGVSLGPVRRRVNARERTHCC